MDLKIDFEYLIWPTRIRITPWNQLWNLVDRFTYKGNPGYWFTNPSILLSSLPYLTILWLPSRLSHSCTAPTLSLHFADMYNCLRVFIFQTNFVWTQCIHRSHANYINIIFPLFFSASRSTTVIDVHLAKLKPVTRLLEADISPAKVLRAHEGNRAVWIVGNRSTDRIRGGNRRQASHIWVAHTNSDISEASPVGCTSPALLHNDLADSLDKMSCAL